MQSPSTDNVPPGTESDDLSGQVRSAIGRLHRRFRSERPVGELGDTALEVLGFLHTHGPHTLTELSEVGQVAAASMSQSVNRLTSSGYAERARDSTDRRKVLFSVTPAGAKLASVTRTQRNAWLQAQLSRLSLEDQDVIARACRVFSTIADS